MTIKLQELFLEENKIFYFSLVNTLIKTIMLPVLNTVSIFCLGNVYTFQQKCPGKNTNIVSGIINFLFCYAVYFKASSYSIFDDSFIILLQMFFFKLVIRFFWENYCGA